MSRFLEWVFISLLSFSEDVRLSPLESLERWMSGIKVPVTLYIVMYGMAGSVLSEHLEEWGDLGLCRCLPDAKVARLTAGVFDILDNDHLIADLQDGNALTQSNLWIQQVQDNACDTFVNLPDNRFWLAARPRILFVTVLSPSAHCLVCRRHQDVHQVATCRPGHREHRISVYKFLPAAR